MLTVTEMEKPTAGVAANTRNQDSEAADIAATRSTTTPAAKPTLRMDDASILQLIEEYIRYRDRDISQTGRTDALPVSYLKGRIAQHFTPLVESIARRFISSGEPFEDLVQEGFLGLLSALEHFDPEKKVKFSTYATHFIAGSIRHCLRDRGRIIKEPAWLHELYGKINRTSDALTQTLGRAPHPAEIAETLNLTEDSVSELLSTKQVFQVVAFDTPADSGDDSLVGLVDPEKIRSDKYVTLHLPIEDRIVLEEAATKLKALEQKVLFEFFYKDLNQTEIARKFGISCNYVSHILKNSTKKLRKMMGEAEVRDRTRSREDSIVDHATGLYTAVHTLGRGDEALSRAARAGQTAAVLLIAFSSLPPAGPRRDEIWSLCGESVKKSIRRVDIAGRYNDDCLIVVLPQTGAQVSVVADRLLSVLLTVGATHHGRFTVRISTATYPDSGRTIQDLVEAAQSEMQETSALESLSPVPSQMAA